MTWQEAIATVVVLLGLGAGAFLIAQRPAFWVEFAWRVVYRLWPSVSEYLAKRMSPEDEAAWRAAVRAGRGDEWLRERARKKRKGIF